MSEFKFDVSTTVYVVMANSPRNFNEVPHSVYLTRKEALDAIKRMEKKSRSFYFIERSKLMVPA